MYEFGREEGGVGVWRVEYGVAMVLLARRPSTSRT